MLLVILLVLITACYLGLIAALVYGWKKLPPFDLTQARAKTGFSIVIPYRDEAENLPDLFKSLTSLHYPFDLFEIILVNDASRDQSRLLCEDFQKGFPEMNISLLENKRRSGSPKKDAVRTGIDHSKFDYIATTDADCLLPPNWLRGFDQEICQNDPKLIAGPVGFVRDELNRQANFQKFEEMDFLSLQSTSIGSFGLEKPFMCNAANLCFQKKAFLENSGYMDNEEIASGDDVFLLQALRKNGARVSFIRSEKFIVYTKFQKSLAALVHQRMRWAGKATSYTSKFGSFAGLLVFSMNLLLILASVMALAGFINYQFVLLAFLLKFNADFILIYKAATFFKREAIMRSYFWCSMVYPFFSVYVASLSLVKTYEWKGRRFKK